jgi:membrane protein implicated in regulation of membrane protease activity
VITAGILGGFAAIDAIFLFLFLVGAAFFVGLNPYIGLVMFVVLPVITVLGGATAWTAYCSLKHRTPRSQATHQAVA